MIIVSRTALVGSLVANFVLGMVIEAGMREERPNVSTLQPPALEYNEGASRIFYAPGWIGEGEAPYSSMGGLGYHYCDEKSRDRYRPVYSGAPPTIRLRGIDASVLKTVNLCVEVDVHGEVLRVIFASPIGRLLLLALLRGCDRNRRRRIVALPDKYQRKLSIHLAPSSAISAGFLSRCLDRELEFTLAIRNGEPVAGWAMVTARLSVGTTN